MILKTKEDINFQYLRDPLGTNLKGYMLEDLVEKNDEIRQAILDLGDPDLVLYYAKYVDKCPRDDVREFMCRGHWSAYCYAVSVDRCPRDDTRTAASKNEYSKKYYDAWVRSLKRN